MRSYEFLEAVDELPIGLKIRNGRSDCESFESIAVEFMVSRNEWIHPNNKWERVEGVNASHEPARKFLPNI